MSDTKLSVQQSSSPAPSTAKVWHPIETLRHEFDRLIDEFDNGGWFSPTRRTTFLTPRWARELKAEASAPAVDIVEKDGAYEISAELPGIDSKNVEVNVANGDLIIRGEKHEEKEEKKKGYYLRERHFGSFERCFRIPDGVDSGKIEAGFNNGVLTVTLPKSAQAKQSEKKIPIKATA